MNCIIIDDEPLAIQLLENHIAKINRLKLVGTARSAIEAYEIMKRKPVELLFLDIQMPNLTGIEFLKSINQKPKVIFTTAYREYAVEGFELEAVDYMLKPITFERFFKAVNRLFETSQKNEVEYLILKSEGMHHKVNPDDIFVLESQGNDIKVWLKDAGLIFKGAFSDIEVRLAEIGFLRVHRSYMINTKHISAFNSNEVQVGPYKIAVGRSYKKNYEDFISHYGGQRLI